MLNRPVKMSENILNANAASRGRSLNRSNEYEKQVDGGSWGEFTVCTCTALWTGESVLSRRASSQSWNSSFIRSGGFCGRK